MALWAERERAEFFDIYHVPQENQLRPVQLFHPGYYHSLSIRLYNFDGKAVTPEKTLVISYQKKISQEGVPYKEITGVEEFASYEEAKAYISTQESANYQIVSDNPFVSPVPLAALEDYKLIHSSDDAVQLPGTGITVPQVKIFEYVGKE